MAKPKCRGKAPATALILPHSFVSVREIASSPVFEFPYTGYPAASGFDPHHDLSSILTCVASATDGHVYNQQPAVTLKCVPQINTGVTGNTTVYQVPEDMPVDMILEQLGINTHTLHTSNTMSNYYRTSSFQPVELILPPIRPRRLVCREVSDSDDESYLRRPSHHHHRHSSDQQYNNSQQNPLSMHNVLSRVWDRAERGSRNMQSSQSAPNINSQWQAMRNASPITPNSNTNNIWQAMRNAPTPTRPDHHDAIDRVWQRAEYASELLPNRSSNLFNPMQPPSTPFPNQEAVRNFNAMRNLPYGINASPTPFPNQEAVRNFNAMRNLPYGINASPTPFPNQEAVRNFNAMRNLPYGINASPGPSNAAVNNFFAARNVPGGINQPNPAIANVWNRAGSAASQGPPMINGPWNQGPPSPSMNNMWNRMQQGANAPMYPPSLMNPLQRGPVSSPAPMSFAALLSQAHRQGLPYAGAS